MKKSNLYPIVVVLLIIFWTNSTTAQILEENSFTYIHEMPENELRGIAKIESFSRSGVPSTISIVVENYSDEIAYEFYVSRFEDASFVIRILDVGGQIIAQSRIRRIEEHASEHFNSYSLPPKEKLDLSFTVSNLIDLGSFESDDKLDVRYVFQFYTSLQLKNENKSLGVTVFEFRTELFMIEPN